MARVFLSWSGDLSKEVALVLKRWLPCVLHSIKTFMSAEDIAKGSPWSLELGSELEKLSFCVVCVTSENFKAPWLNFEAGALSRSLSKSRVAPVMFGISPRDISGPLKLFQSTEFERDEIFRLLKSINNFSDPSEVVPENILNASFEKFWPDLEASIRNIEAEEFVRADARETPEILRELVELNRAQSRILADPESILPPNYLRSALVKALATHRSGEQSSAGYIEPVIAVASARHTITGILNCRILDSYDVEALDAFLEHRADQQVKVRRLVVADHGHDTADLTAALKQQSKEHRNYEVRFALAGQLEEIGSWAFSVIDRRYVVVRLPGNQAFAVIDERASYVLGEYFERLWSSLTSREPNIAAGTQKE